MRLTPEQLATRRANAKEKIDAQMDRKRSKQQVSSSPEDSPKKWARRGVQCDRSEGLVDKLRRMREVETSSLVPQSVYDMRMSKCPDCKHCSERVDGLLFCECCGCLAWTFKILKKFLGKLRLGADLQSKNWHAQHECLAEVSQFGVYEKGENDGDS